MKAFSIARKTLLETWRERKLLVLMLSFPALLVIVYYIAFGQNNQGMAQALKVLILNQDTGGTGAQFVKILQDTRFDGKPVFTTAIISDQNEAGAALQERKAALLLIIPWDFTQRLQTLNSENPAARPEPALLRMVGDTTSDNYLFASSFLMTIADQFTKQFTGWHRPESDTVDFVSGTGTLSDFQFGVPGILIFGVMFGTISSAIVLVREDTGKTLQRLRLARVNAADILIGIALAHMVLAAVGIPVAFGTALIFGFQSPGSLALAVGIGMLLSLAATGGGLIAACFAHSDGSAANIGTVVMMPLVFLSGAIFPLPAIPLATLGGRVVNLYDIMPTTHAATAMRRVLIYGDPPSAIAFELIALAILSVLYLVIGIVLYQRLRLRCEPLT